MGEMNPCPRGKAPECIESPDGVSCACCGCAEMVGAVETLRAQLGDLERRILSEFPRGPLDAIRALETLIRVRDLAIREVGVQARLRGKAEAEVEWLRAEVARLKGSEGDRPNRAAEKE